MAPDGALLIGEAAGAAPERLEILPAGRYTLAELLARPEGVVVWRP